MTRGDATLFDAATEPPSSSLGPPSGRARRDDAMPVRPLLKWAGGKRQLLPELRRFYPRRFLRYHEPFLGSGAVFFDLWSTGRLHGRRATLTDSSPDLIGCYRMVRDHAPEVVRHLTRLAKGHAADSDTHFYAVRDRFNALRRDPLAAPAAGDYTPALAAMLIYLNRTAFNGLFRLNAQGRFNVPAGRYARPRICDPAHIAVVGDALRRRTVRLERSPFESVRSTARAGDFLYFDPPYAPMSHTARFTAYTSHPFTLEDHARLKDLAVELAAKGCRVMVSNSSAPAIEALYEGEPGAAAAGLRVYRLAARRAINSRPAARGAVTELLLTNIEPEP